MSVDPRKFKTKTIIAERDNPKRADIWPIGLDIGYSAVKGFSPNAIFCYPSFAKKQPEGVETIGEPKDTDIEYKDMKTGEVWFVGEVAETFATASDTDQALYNRQRYFSDSFRVICEVGIALGMLNNRYGSMGSKRPVIQTGLPPEYKKNDEEDLKAVFVGTHEFAIKVGKSEWVPFSFELKENDVYVMDQPMGGLISATITDSGKASADSKRILSSNVIIFDIGFGTADIYEMKNGRIINKNTFDDLAMKRVFKETAEVIDDQYKKKLSTIQMQEVLEKGTFSVFDRRKRTATVGEIAPVLEECSKKVCEELLNTILDMCDINDYAYILLDGGTAAAWYSYITEFFAGMKETLSIISASKDDTISPVFANVRGYYMYLFGKKNV